MNNFTLTLLGTASAMPVRDRNQSAQVLQVRERLFLIDCGEGTQGQMVRLGIPMMKLDAVFLSHIHGDHVFGIFGLLSTLGMKGRQAPLYIYAPVNFGPVLKFFLSYYGEGIPFEIHHVPLKMKAPEVVFDGKTVEVLAFPLSHGIETFGFLFREKEPMWNVRKDAIETYGFTLTEIGAVKRGEDVVRPDRVIPNAEVAYKPYVPRSYAYCSDTEVFPEEAEWLRGVDLLYHEATYLEEFADKAVARHHATTLQVAALARDAGAGRLVVAHFSSRCTDAARYEAECRSVFPDTCAGRDGDVFEIGK